MVMVGSHVNDAGGLRSVVAGKHDHRVVRHAELLERFDELTDDPVKFMNEIAMRPGLRAALKRLRCK